MEGGAPGTLPSRKATCGNWEIEHFLVEGDYEDLWIFAIVTFDPFWVVVGTVGEILTHNCIILQLSKCSVTSHSVPRLLQLEEETSLSPCIQLNLQRAVLVLLRRSLFPSFYERIMKVFLAELNCVLKSLKKTSVSLDLPNALEVHKTRRER